LLCCPAQWSDSGGHDCAVFGASLVPSGPPEKLSYSDCACSTVMDAASRLRSARFAHGLAARRIRHDGWTIDRQVKFICGFRATGSVTRGARAAGMSRESAYRLRDPARPRRLRAGVGHGRRRQRSRRSQAFGRRSDRPGRRSRRSLS
jgi:hypothetical protein